MTPHCKFQVGCGNFYTLVIPLTHSRHKQHYNCYDVICHGTKSHVFQSKEFTLTIALYLFSKLGTFCENLRQIEKHNSRRFSLHKWNSEGNLMMKLVPLSQP